MKSSDLMVGDWVMSRRYIGPSRVFATYLNTSDDRFAVIITNEAEDGSATAGHTMNELTPIPLTKEILEKNGFEHEDTVGYVYDDYATSNKVIVDMWDGTIKILHNYDIAFSRTYWRAVNVHELQHVLRLFEIEKEIIL